MSRSLTQIAQTRPQQDCPPPPSRAECQSRMHFAVGLIPRLGCAALATGLLAAAALPPGVNEAPFLAENNAAMARMMDGMAIKPSGDADADFAGMMIPHHQGAIDMAEAELRYGHNEQLRRIAQEIVVDQQQEIVTMRLALHQKLPRPAPAPTQTPALPGGPRVPARIR